MRLSRRSFTKEFKAAAVRRLELGASRAEVRQPRTTCDCCGPAAGLVRSPRSSLRLAETGVKILFSDLTGSRSLERVDSPAQRP